VSAEDRAQERQDELWAYITQRPHQSMVIPDVAYALGRSPGAQFGKDLAAVRHKAAREGCQITNNYWDKLLKCSVFTFLPEGDEAEMSFKPLRNISRQARTRMRNVTERAQYVEVNAVRSDDQTYAAINVKMGKAMEQMMSALDLIETVIHQDVH
jgi:hypothetical protein